jgi:ubiquinone/menaquinone biosynthesis C-methylase UbiE
VKFFQDHFSGVASAYAAFRPHYPDELYRWLAEACVARERAWDCACGSGQATLALAGHFGSVVASDASAAQIAAAPHHARVAYRVAPAEASGLEPASIDLIVVAQALHWFDLTRFYAEACRVGKAGSVLAAWSYGMLAVDDPGIDALSQRFYADTLGPYWPPERRHVESGYRTLHFPFEEIPAPALSMRTRWSLPQLLGMLRSWSAVARYVEAVGRDPVSELAPVLAEPWSDPRRECTITWPLALRVGRLSPP